MMRYRRLGTTGLIVSEVGLGGAGLGHVWGPTTDADAQDAVDCALSAGVNFFDVSPVYGDGRAEQNLGIALEGRREQAVIATKVYLAPQDLDDIAGAIERELHASLRRLRTDHVDLYQLHNLISREPGGVSFRSAKAGIRSSLGVHDILRPGGVAEVLHRLKQTSAVRNIGCTGVGEAEAVRQVLQEGRLDSVQVYYNLLNRSAARELPPGFSMHDHGRILPLAAQLGMATIGIRNLAAGALTTTADRPLDADTLIGRDRQRAASLAFLTAAADYPAASSADTAADTTAHPSAFPLSQWATRFVLQHDAISTVVPGAKNRAEIADAVSSIDLPPLSPEQERRLTALAVDDFGVAEPVPGIL